MVAIDSRSPLAALHDELSKIAEAFSPFIDQELEFEDLYTEALEWAKARVVEQSEKGENAKTDIPGMFPHGVPDLTFMLHTKTQRILGYETTENWQQIAEEARDLINYAAFLIALMRLEGDIEWK